MREALARSIADVAAISPDSGRSSPVDNRFRESLRLMEQLQRDIEAVRGASTSRPRRNASDIFLDALRSNVVGDDDVVIDDADSDDEDGAEVLPISQGVNRDVRLTALSATLSAVGVPISVRRSIERVINRFNGTAAPTDNRSLTMYSSADIRQVLSDKGYPADEVRDVERRLAALPTNGV